MVRKIFIILLFFILTPYYSLSSRDKVIAVILATNIQRYKIAAEQFEKTFKTLNKGMDVQFLLSTPNPDPSSWANAIKRAEGYDVDMIIAFGAPLVNAAIKENVSSPIIFADIFEKELVEKAKNVKIGGLYNNIPLGTLVKHISSIKKLDVLYVYYNPLEAESERQAKKLGEVCQLQGAKCEPIEVKSVAKILGEKLDPDSAIFITSSVLLETGLARIITFANNHNVPVIGLTETVTDKGGLFSIAINPQEQGDMLAKYATDFIKTGKLPENRQVTKVDFIINLESAKRLNINVPFQVLNSATKVLK
ncbi:MAG: hypothetical protein N2999_07500 [Proteobacteria bacterium]|nr:hypothetical protein [Pseudomonadota bacterium]